MRELVAVEGLGGTWPGCVCEENLGAIGEGMEAALMVLEVEVLGWVLHLVGVRRLRGQLWQLGSGVSDFGNG